jgi:hypothetical protein
MGKPGTILPSRRRRAAACLGVLAGILAGPVACDEGAGEGSQACRNGMSAFAAATDFARGRLALPPMAQEPGGNVSIPGGRTEYLGDCRHKVTSRVERRDPAGAILDDRFEATVRLRGDAWELEAITFY